MKDACGWRVNSSNCYHLEHKKCLELYMEQIMSNDQQSELAWEDERQSMVEKCAYNTLERSEMDQLEQEFQRCADAPCGVGRHMFNAISPDDEREKRFTPKRMERLKIPKWQRPFCKCIEGKYTYINFHITGFRMLA